MGIWDNCCGKCKPKCKRLVDNIYPATAEEGIERSHLDKLVFYSLSHPDKLDKIGKYLLFCLEYYATRRRYEYAKMTMEAMDSLLLACKSSDQHTRLNLFVESFLKMNLLLLECQDVTLQCHAVQSFVKFADIPEDIPSYHRSYDQFVDKFSMMCYNNDPNPANRKAIRRAGMMGIRGIIRKTVSDDLQVNIWEPVHMDKIIPALIFSMQQKEDLKKGIRDAENGAGAIQPMDLDELETFASGILQEICGRTMFANIKNVMSPALKHIDNNDLWIPGDFAIQVIKKICYAIPNQYAYKAVQIIVGHLDNHVKSAPEIKTSITNCLAQTVEIATSVGPSVFEVFSALLRHLKISVDRQIQSSVVEPGEQLYQEALVVTIGEFATNLPDYQKIEIMRFIMDKVVVKGGEDSVSATWLPLLLLRSLLKVATKYVPVQMTTTFPIAFLDLLMRASLSSSTEVRILVHAIFHTLMDRHGNLSILLDATVVPSHLELRLQDPPSTEDANFAKTSVRRLVTCLFDNYDRHDNTTSLFRSLNITALLVLLELGKVSDEVVTELIRFFFGVQELAVSTPDFSTLQRNAMFAASACGFSLIPYFVNAPFFAAHIQGVISERENSFPYALPATCYIESSTGAIISPAKSPLRSPSKSVPMSGMNEFLPFFSLQPLLDDIANNPLLRLDVDKLEDKYVGSQLDTEKNMDRRSISSQSNSVLYENEEEHSEADKNFKTPDDHGPLIDEDITMESFRRILHDSGDSTRESMLEKAKQMNYICKNLPFKELITRQEKMASRLSLTVLKILRTPPISSPSSSSDEESDFGEPDVHDATPNEKLETKIKRRLRKMSSPYVDPSEASDVHAK